MCYQKLFFVSVLFAGLLMMGCDKKDKESDSVETGSVTEIDLDKVMKSPYSDLSPNEQKVKLEQECIDLLNDLNAATSLQAIDVFENFIDLLDRDEPEIDDPWQEGNSKKTIQSIFKITNVYGVFTWNRNQWVKTSSKSELKFVFPANGRTGDNNASLSLKAVNSNATFIEEWYDDWNDETYEDIIYLPSSATGILTVDKKEIAKIEANAKYRKDPLDFDGIYGNPPESSQFKITTSEKYVFWYHVSGSGNETKYEMQLSFDKNPLIEAQFKVGIGLEKFFDKVESVEEIEDLKKIFGKVATMGYLKLMDNLVLIYQVDDIPQFAIEIDKIFYEEPDYWYNPDYYKVYGQNLKKSCDNMAKAMNDYMVVSLASTKDGTKIAELVAKSEKVGEHWNNDFWNGSYWSWGNNYTWKYDEYDLKLYLRFGDKSLVEAEAYFSEGFGRFENKWEDFVDAFNR